MGIKNLKRLIQKHAPGAISNNFTLYNKRIVIDSSILLYKFRYKYSQDNFHIQGFLYKVIELLEDGIIPIFVFDGPPPLEKQQTLEKRIDNRKKMQERVNELTNTRNTLGLCIGINPEEYIHSDDEETDESGVVNEIKKLNNAIKTIEKNILIVKKIHSDEVMEFLKSLGIPFFKATSESEETCAYLQKHGYADYVLTEDTDALTFGAKQVIFGDKVYHLDIILSEMDLSFDSFVDLCILCGCDYTGTIPKIGPVSALRLIKKYNTIDNFENVVIPDDFDYQSARSIFKQNEKYKIQPNFEIVCMDLKKTQEMFERYSLNNFFLEKLKILIKCNNEC